MTVYAIGCVTWEEKVIGFNTNYTWSLNNSCLSPTISNKIIKNSFEYGTLCTCTFDDKKLFTAMAVHLPHRRYGFLQVRIDAEQLVSLLVPGIISLILIIYLAMLLIAYFLDKHDKARVRKGETTLKFVFITFFLLEMPDIFVE